MSLHRLELVDFRGFDHAVLSPDPEGTTVLTGPNGAGKTTVLEAIAYLGTLRSFRGAPRDVMVRAGCARAVLRADLERDGRAVLVEAELPVTGRPRCQVNRQAVRSRAGLAEAVPVTVFSPEDLAIVQGGPARRRDLLDDALELVDRQAGRLVDEVERILRQRGTLLRQASGRLRPDVAATLDVWDERLASAGTRLAAARDVLTSRLEPLVSAAYGRLAAGPGPRAGPAPVTDPGPPADRSVTVAYRPSWDGDLADALARARPDDLRRGVNTVGPHRDDVELAIAGRPARLQASQGEQRTLALALRLGTHQLAADRSAAPPILLLDDVFSELDPWRSRALVEELPGGQALVTTAVPLPPGVEVARTVDVRELPSPSAGTVAAPVGPGGSGSAGAPSGAPGGRHGPDGQDDGR